MWAERVKAASGAAGRCEGAVPHPVRWSARGGLLRLRGLFPPWADHAFTTRAGGVSEGPYATFNLAFRTGDAADRVRENHRRLAQALGYRVEDLGTVHQVHGRRIVTLRSPEDAARLPAEDADGILLIPKRGLWGPGRPAAAAVRVADCCPVLVASTLRRVGAVLHCGWRSLVAGIIRAGVEALGRAGGVRPESLVAAIGPCIGPAAFEVGEDVAAAFARRVGPRAVIRRAEWRRPHVDLARASRMLLVRAGLVPAHVRTIRRCTYSEPAVFYSYRRDGARSGRHMGVLVISA